MNKEVENLSEHSNALKRFMASKFGRWTRCTLMITVLILLLNIALGGLITTGIIVGAISTAIIMSSALFIANRAGDSANLFGGRKSAFSLREQLCVDLDRAKYFRKNKKYKEAHEVVGIILGKSPDMPEALLLNAQIVWEGFGNREAAKGYLKRVLEVVPDEKESLHVWALSLNEKLTMPDNESS
jgi:hypothetical protein